MTGHLRCGWWPSQTQDTHLIEVHSYREIPENTLPARVPRSHRCHLAVTINAHHCSGEFQVGMVSIFSGTQPPPSRPANSTQVSRSFSWRFVLACLLFAAAVRPLCAQSLTPRAAPVSITPAAKQVPPNKSCFRGSPGDEVPQPPDLRSQDGELKVDLAFRSSTDPKGKTRYCYVTPDGAISPTLRVTPGDTVILTLKNEVIAAVDPATPVTGPAPPALDLGLSAPAQTISHRHTEPSPASSCAGGAMKPASTNLHFHGLTVPATCHQDDVLHTLIEPGDLPYEYRFQIPRDEPPGLYWYHPHIHGYTKAQVLGGASGALIVEGIERAVPELAGLPERVLILRDQDLLNPDAAPSTIPGNALPPVVLDADGDVMNTGTGTGKPAEDLSLNFVPVPFPDYPPALITIKPGERQLWRVLNASAITYLSLQLLFDREVQGRRGRRSRRCPHQHPQHFRQSFHSANPSRRSPRWAHRVHRQGPPAGRSRHPGDP
jgi:FtsP/CotA-like multicopper oxidase with cupredoxin domain